MGSYHPIDPAAADPAPAPATALAIAADVAAPAPARHDGWTAERQRVFLETLAASGCVTEAAAAAGMSVRSAYRLRARAEGDAFDRGWSEAVRLASDRLTAVAFDRAVNGVERKVWYKGEVVGTDRVPSEAMLLFLLKAYDSFNRRWGRDERTDYRRSARDRFGEALDEIEHPEAYAGEEAEEEED